MSAAISPHERHMCDNVVSRYSIPYMKKISFQNCNWTARSCFIEGVSTQTFLCPLRYISKNSSVGQYISGLDGLALLRLCNFMMSMWVVPCSDFSNESRDMVSTFEHMVCATPIKNENTSSLWAVPPFDRKFRNLCYSALKE